MESIPSHPTPILVVDDDQGLLLSIKATLLSAGIPEPALASDSRQVMALLRQNTYQVVLLDLVMPHIGGMELLRQIKAEFPNIECIVVSAVDEAGSAVEALGLGAYDYLVKPINGDKLVIVVSHALERYNLKYEISLYQHKQTFADLGNPDAFKDMIAEDDAMALVFRQIETVAPTGYSVVIEGESGTGKEMLARILHNLSNRSEAPFVAVNMAAVSRTIFEDEFFGHTKGAYTDAASEKKGYFEAADGGTLFLDEITELDPSLQAKLLRVIEERELYRLGSTQVRDINARIIAATNRDINRQIATNRFRADLYYRLNKYRIKVPPLRERVDDILPLARHFTRTHAKANNKPIEALSPELVEALLGYSYPGNVRELENLIASAVLLETEKELTLSSFPELCARVPRSVYADNSLIPLVELEKQHILKVLEYTNGNKAEAAAILGINTSTVYRKIEKYQLIDRIPSF